MEPRQQPIWLTDHQDGGGGYMVDGPKTFPNRKRLKDAGAVFDKATKKWQFAPDQRAQAEAAIDDIVQFYDVSSGAAVKRLRPAAGDDNAPLPPMPVAMTKDAILERLRCVRTSSAPLPDDLTLRSQPEGPVAANAYVDVEAYLQAAPIGGYCLTGRDLLLLRDCIPLQRIATGHDQKPRYYRGQGYHYVENAVNLQRLRRLVHSVQVVRREMVDKLVVVEQSIAPLNKLHGILAWDVPFVSPAWMGLFVDKAACARDDRLNPILNADGTYHFQKASFTIASADAALRHVRRKDDEKVVFPYLHDGTTITHSMQLLAFTQHPDARQVVALAAWSGHARYLVRDVAHKHIHVYDPWKQTQGAQAAFVREAKDSLEPSGWTWQFVAHRKDQGTGEGSCMVAALARVLMVAHRGACNDALHATIEPAFALLASRLMSHFRNARPRA